MRLVVLESPYSGDTERNVRYAQDCIRDCLARNEAPIASHLLFPRILDDSVPHQRAIGMTAGHAWIRRADAIVVYTDRGVTAGMKAGINRARACGVDVEYRELTKETERDLQRP